MLPFDERPGEIALWVCICVCVSERCCRSTVEAWRRCSALSLPLQLRELRNCPQSKPPTPPIHAYQQVRLHIFHKSATKFRENEREMRERLLCARLLSVRGREALPFDGCSRVLPCHSSLASSATAHNRNHLLSHKTMSMSQEII